jgi:hypothetical protein
MARTRRSAWTPEFQTTCQDTSLNKDQFEGDRSVSHRPGLSSSASNCCQLRMTEMGVSSDCRVSIKTK